MPRFQITVRPTTFLKLGLRLIGQPAGSHAFRKEMMNFRAFFGASPANCSFLWGKLEQHLLVGHGRPEHLLWALMQLKVYSHEKVMANLACVHPDTFTEWAFYYIERIAKLKPDFVSEPFATCHCIITHSHFLMCGLGCRSSGPIDTDPPFAPKRKCLLTERTFASVTRALDGTRAISSSSQAIDMKWLLQFSPVTLYGRMGHFQPVLIRTLTSFAKH